MQYVRQYIYNLLRKSEAFFKTDMVYLAKGGFWLTGAQIVASASAFVLSLVFANVVHPEIYGQYKYVLSLASTLGAFSLLGLGTGVLRSTAQGQEGSLRKAFTQNLKFSFVLILIGLGTGVYYWTQGNHFLATAILIVTVLTPLLNSATLYSSFLNGKKDFRATTLFTSAVIVANTVTMIVALLVTKNPLILVVAYFTSQTVCNLIAYAVTLFIYKPNNEVNEKELTTYSVHQSIVVFLGTVASQIDKILVFQQLGAVQLALYSFAIAMPDQIKGVFKNVSRLAFPKFVSVQLHTVHRRMYYQLFLLGIVVFILSLFYIGAAPYIYRLLFPQYIESIVFSQIYALGLFTVISFVPVTALQAQNLNKSMYIFTISSNVLQIIALFISMESGVRFLHRSLPVSSILP
jgi:O-antigen/teichoic acid export membrane protein